MTDPKPLVSLEKYKTEVELKAVDNKLMYQYPTYVIKTKLAVITMKGQLVSVYDRADMNQAEIQDWYMRKRYNEF